MQKLGVVGKMVNSLKIFLTNFYHLTTCHYERAKTNKFTDPGFRGKIASNHQRKCCQFCDPAN